ncbi:MAG: tyrosine-type recombinase/integrase, partial [Spirochaetaceae bacterium]
MKNTYPEPYRRAGRGKNYYFTYRDGDGKQHVKSTGKEGKDDARGEIRKFIDRMHSGTGQTFRDYAEPYFIPGRCPREARLKPEGKNYGERHMLASRANLENHVLIDGEPFAEIPLNEIRRRDVLDLRARLVKRCPGPSAAGAALTAVKTILSEATIREDLPGNPGLRVAPPTISLSEQREKPGRAFTPEEVTRILQYAEELCITDKAKSSDHLTDRTRRPRAEVLLHILFTGGLRVGEAIVLKWKDFDLENRRFSVVRAAKDKDGRTEGLPKWDKVRENLAMPELLAEALGEWRAHLEGKMGGAMQPDDYVLMSADRYHVLPTWVTKTWKRVIEHAQSNPNVKLEVGHRKLTPHSTRHSVNSHLLMVKRLHPLDVQSFLGWESEAGKMITKVQSGYTDLNLLDTSKVAKAIDELYRQPDPGELR